MSWLNKQLPPKISAVIPVSSASPTYRRDCGANARRCEAVLYATDTEKNARIVSAVAITTVLMHGRGLRCCSMPTGALRSVLKYCRSIRSSSRTAAVLGSAARCGRGDR